MARAASAAGGLGRVVGGFGRTLASGARLIGTFGAAIATAFGISAIRGVIDFQERLATINTIAQLDQVVDGAGNIKILAGAAYDADSQLGQLGKDLRAIAIDRGMRLDDLTESYYEFLSAGITIGPTFEKARKEGTLLATQNKILQATTDLAVGGLSSEADATRLMSFALNAFNLNSANVAKDVAKNAGVMTKDLDTGTMRVVKDVGEASRSVADYFAKAVEIGVVQASQIASTFSTVAATAQQAGIGIDEIAAAYAAQTTRGVSAARVTVSMNRAIQDLIQPSKTLKEQQKELGKNYAEIARTQGIHVAFEQMRLDANKLGNDYRDLFKRQEGWRFALNITSDNINDSNGNYQQYIRTLERVRNATNDVAEINGTLYRGTAAIQAAIRGDTITRNLIKLQEAFRSLGITIGYWFLLPINDAVKAVTRIIRAIDLWLQDLTPAERAIARQGAAVLGLVSAFLALSGGLQAFLIVASRVAGPIGLTATNLYGLQKIIGALFLPLGLLAGVIGGFAILVDNNVRGFGHFRHELDDLKTLAGGLIGVLQSVADGIGFVFRQISRGEDAGRAVSHALDTIGQKVEDLGPVFQRVVTFIGRLFLTLGIAIVNALQVAIPAIVHWAADVVRTVAPVVARIVGFIALEILHALPKVIGTLSQFVREVFANFQKFITENGPAILTAVGRIVQSIVGWVGRVGPQILSGLAGVVGSIVNWIASVAPQIADAVGQWAVALSRWVITDAIPALLRFLGELVRNVANWIQQTQTIRQITNAILTWVAGFIAGLAVVFTEIATWVIQNADTILDAIIDVGAQIVGGFVDFLMAHGAEIAAAALFLAATFVGELGKAILNDPTILVKFVVALFTVRAIAAAVGLAGRAAGLLFGTSAGAAIATEGTAAIAAGTATAVGAGTAAGVARGGLMAKLGAVLGFLWRGVMGLPVVSAAITFAATLASELYIGALSIARSLALAVALAWGTLSASSGFTGAIIGAAGVAVSLFRAAISKAFLLAPLIILAKIVTDALPENVRPGAPFKNALDQGFRDHGRLTPEEILAGAKQDGTAYAKTFADWSKTTFDTTDFIDMRDPLQAAQHEADTARENMERQFNKPLQVPNLFAEVQPTAVEAATAAAAAASSALGNITLPTSIVQDLKSKLDSIIHPTDPNTGKPGKIKFVNDATRIRGINAQIKEAQKNLDIARSKGDSVTAGLLQDFINGAQGDIDKIKAANAAIKDSQKANEAALAANQKVLAEIKLRETRQQQNKFGETTGSFVDRNPPPVPKAPVVPKPPPPITKETALGAYVAPIRDALTQSQQLVEHWKEVVGASGATAMEKVKSGASAGQKGVTGVFGTLLSAAGGLLRAVNFTGYGRSMIGTLVAGILSMIPAVTAASNKVASAAGHSLRAESPPKEPPLSNIGKWARRTIEWYANNISGAAPLVRSAVGTVAMAAASSIDNIQLATPKLAFATGVPVSIEPRQREIVPMTRGGGRGGIGYDDNNGISDRDLMLRNTELLGQIAASTQVGAAAAARQASVDPVAGGPLAQRGTLSQLRHLSHGRSI